MAASMVTTVTSNNVHSSITLMSDEMAAAMMAAKASHDMLPAVGSLDPAG